MCYSHTKSGPNNIPYKSFFVSYRNEKYSIPALDVKSLLRFLMNLKNSSLGECSAIESAHCLRRSPAILCADTLADIVKLKQYGGWKSLTEAEEYVEQSLSSKLNVTQKF